MGPPWWFSGYDSALALRAAWVQSLVRELRSCMPQVWPKKRKKLSIIQITLFSTYHSLVFLIFFSFYDKILLKVYKMSIVPPKRYYFYGTRKHFSNLNLIKPQILATFFSQIVKITFYLLFVFNINLFILIGG